MCSFSIYPFSILNQVGIKTCKLNNTIFPIDSPLNFTFFKQLKILQIPQLDLMQNLFSPTEMISFILQVCRIADEANCTISTCMVAVVLQDNILIHIQFLHKSTTYEQSYYDISLWYEFEWLEAGSIWEYLLNYQNSIWQNNFWRGRGSFYISKALIVNA